MSKTKEWKFETKAIHIGQETPDKETDARAVPIHQTTAYVFHNSEHAADRFGLRDAGNIYSRLTNPTQDVLEQRIASLEGGAASLAVSSGSAALNYAFQTLAFGGGHIVSEKTIYGGTYNLLNFTLRNQGIQTTFVDADDIKNFEDAIQDDTKAIFIETLGNPNSNVKDYKKIADLAHKNNIPLIVDATFTPPNVIRPIEFGADIVIHSLTKFIGGHGTGLGGIITEAGTFDWKKSGKFKNLTDPNPSYHGVAFFDAVGPAAFVTFIRAILLRDTGATIAPLNTFLFLLGLETLSLRVERHIQNALKVIEYLKGNPKVKNVYHPSLKDDKTNDLYNKYYPNGAGSIFTFEIDGDKNSAFKFIDSLELFSLLANVADVKSLVIHPKTTTHSQLTEEELEEQNIFDNTIRLSVGTENIDDIIADLEQAFAKI